MMRIIRPCLFVAALWPALVFAQQTPATTTSYPEWDKLTPAQREAIIAPLRNRWNDSPSERGRMLERAQRWQSMPTEQRERARRGMQRWEQMPPDKRENARALFRSMRDMDQQQRKAFLAEWRQKTPQQRADWLKAHPLPERASQPRKPGRQD